VGEVVGAEDHAASVGEKVPRIELLIVADDPLTFELACRLAAATHLIADAVGRIREHQIDRLRRDGRQDLLAVAVVDRDGAVVVVRLRHRA
jgi:hypothetical protein